mgnify:CR=1 FL=1
MSLILKNQRVYEFYNKHSHFDFEKMNVLFVDLLEKFQESAIPSMNANMAAKLFQQMEQLQTQINEKDKNIQYEILKQMVDWKTNHLEELKGVLQTTHVDKVIPLLKDQVDRFHDKLIIWRSQTNDDTLQLQGDMIKKAIQQDIELLSQKTLRKENLHDFVRCIEDRLTSLTNASELRLQERFREHTTYLQDLKQAGNGQDKMNQQVSELLRKMENSSSKGKMSENILGHVIHGLYPIGDIKSVATTKETGDIIMYRDGFPTILFENKNYDRNVGQDEVQKFLRDVETQKCCGILLAQNYGIANRHNYEIHIYQGNVCVYVHNVQYDPDKIKVAVDIIDHLTKFIEQDAVQSDDIQIDLDFINGLNKEYQHFAQQKIAQIKTIKEYSQKMLAHVEEIKLPQYEQWLGKYFSQSLSTKDNQCKYCGFESKSSNGLVSHLRACKKKAEKQQDRTIDAVLSGPEKPAKPVVVSMIPDVNR